MKQSFLLLILFSLIGLLPLQAQKNCCNNLDFFPATFAPLLINNTSGSGEADDVSCSCLAGEGGSTWFSFSAVTTGLLEVLIEPKAPGADFNFALWEGACPCQLPPNSPNPTPFSVSCNNAAGLGPTGIATNPTSSFGVPGSAEFSSSFWVTPGQNYFLLVTNVNNSGEGFTITKGGSAVIASFIPPNNPGVLTGPAQVCQGGDGVFTLSPPVLGANNYAWTVKQNGNQVGITQNGPSPTRALNFPFPTGTYQVCVSASGPQLGCFGSAEKCTTVDVISLPVPAGYESGYVCTNDYYVAGNGETFYFGGTFDLVYQSWQGCDSIVRLTLEQKISDFNVVVREVCAGDCVEWAGETVCETGTYDDVQQNQFGCDSTTQLLLVSVPIETIVNGADTIDCKTPSITLTSNGSVYGANPVYIWKKGNTVVGNGPNLTVTTGGTYTLTINSTVATHTCTDIATVNIIQNTTPPQGVVATGGNANCYTSQVTLMGSSTTPNVTYSWTGPNGFTSNLQNPTVSTQGNYILTVTGTNGCTKTATAVVSENKVAPAAAASTNGTLNCNATSVVLSGSGSSTGSQYTYLWTTSNGNITADETTLTPTVNAAGTYLLTVTNQTNGCTSTATTTVIQLPPVAAQISTSNNVACFGGSSGAATVAASGGTGSYTYEWSNGQTTASVTGLQAGNYSVIVTDDNGCTAMQSVSISQPANLVVNASATAQTIFGVDDGTATANPTGGTGTYTYLWNNGETTQTIIDLAPGNYTVVITDENGCTASQTVTVAAQNCVVKANIDQTNVSCAGAADGSATVNLESATPPFVYAWSNGETTQTVTGLAGGTYDVTATDVFGCEVVTTVIIEEPQPLSPNATATDLTSYDANDGSATANPNGGTTPYTYAWSNGETTETIADLAPGDYTVIVTDANGCSSEQTVTVEQFTCTLSAGIILGEISCNGASDGQATITITGGNAPFTYAWSNGGTTATITGLNAGTYTGTATDGDGCPVVAEAILDEPDALGVQIVNMVEAMCGNNDGSLTIEGTGGTPGYSYLWQSGEMTPDINGINAGVYTVAVTDANGCTENFDVTLGTDDNVPPVAQSQDITIFLDDNGQATANPLDVDNGSSDDCALAAYDLDQTDFNCDDLGDNSVTFTVTDVGNNTSTSNAIITVVDATPPVLNLMDINIVIGPTGSTTIDATMLDNGSTDNCGIVTWTLSQETFGCDSGGPNTVEVIATDASGNSSTATVVVTVAGGSAGPTIDCPSNLTVPYCDPIAEFTVTASDDCGGDVTLTQDTGLPSGSSYPVGTTIVTYTATNSSGVENTCSFEVTVPQTMTVAITTEDVTCFGENDGSATLTPNGGLPPYTYLWSNGDDTPTSTGLVAGQYSATVTDAAGCTSTQTVSIDQPSDLMTSLVSITNATNGQSNGSIDVSVSGGVTPYTFVWKDATGTVIGNSEDISGLPPGNYILLVTDNNGCQSQSGYTIQNSVGTTDSTLDSHVLLYPNPTSGEVTLEIVGLSNLGEVKVSAYDVTGRLMLNNSSSSVKQLLNFTEKPSGVYLVKIVIGEQVLTKRLVVSK